MSSLFKNPNHVLTVQGSSSNHKKILSWLFKDPTNNGLAQFDPAKSNSKKWPKG